jgi:hypothetical protein
MFNPLNAPDPDAHIETRSLTWKENPSLYNGNMTIVGLVESSCTELITNEHVSMGIMDKAGNFREITKIQREGDSDMMYLTIAGDIAEPLDIYVLNEEDEQATPTGLQIDFEANMHQGDILNPVRFRIAEDVCRQLENQTINGNEIGFAVYPTPFRESFHVAYTAADASEKGQIILSDASGRIVYTTDIDISAGRNTYNIQAHNAHLSAGIYLVELRTTDDKKVTRIVKSN